MTDRAMTRRPLLAAGAATAGALPGPAAAAGRPAGADGHAYEVVRTEAEWRAMLDEERYGILRLGHTEWPRTSDLWEGTRDGTYRCRGCELPVFEGRWQVPLDKGWVFFKHAVPNAVLTGIDGPVEQYGMARTGGGPGALIEIHCRRCGSHLGHHLEVAGQNLHCINGKALALTPVDA